MTILNTLRTVCIKAIDEIANAEKLHKETLDLMKQDVQSTRQRSLNLDEDIERAILGFRNRAGTAMIQCERILGELRLSRGQPEIYNISNMTRQEMLDHMNALADMCEETQDELETTAQKLREERKKWWKFW